METVALDIKEKQNEAVLNYFIDPKNLQMGYRQFAETLVKTAVGEGDSPEHQKIIATMSGLMDELQNARQFNNTYLGHMLSEASIPAMTAHMIATRLGGNTVAAEVSKMETRLEPEAIRFLMDTVGFDKEKASGTFTSGGSMAVFTALAVARKKIQENFESRKSLLNALWPQRDKSPRKFFVFTTPMAHYCLDKAIDYLGGQNRGIKKVLVATKDFKMSPEDLERKVLATVGKGTVMAIYAIAGETETGLVDPLGPILKVAQKYGIFTIADAAYGAPYKQSRNRGLFADLPNYDAIIIDGQKALYTPYPNGAVLFRKAEDHALFGLGVKASYIQMASSKNRSEEAKNFTRALLYKGIDPTTGQEVDISKPKTANEDPKQHVVSFELGKKRPEGSGGAGSILSTVATKRTLGIEGLEVVYNITLDRINHLHQKVSESEYLTPMHTPDVNVLCFTLSDKTEKHLKFPSGPDKEKVRNAARKKVLEEIREKLNESKEEDSKGHLIEGSTGYYFSSTDLPTDVVDDEETKKNHEETRKMHYALRAVLMNPKTSDVTLDTAVRQIEEIIKEKIDIASRSN